MTTPSTIQIIRREHDALSAMLRTLRMMLSDARRRNSVPDFGVLRAMLFYVNEFPEKLHHVKESTMLFPRLREYTREADAVLDQLDHDHHRGSGSIRDLEHRLTAWELLGPTRREAFESAAERYVDFYLEHMKVEEEQVLPLAERVFGEDDWRVLDRAFAANRDPLAGGRPEAPYEALFSTIVRITPAPFGLAEPV